MLINRIYTAFQNKKSCFKSGLLGCAAVFMLSACSTTTTVNHQVNDPFEGVNRGIFAFNNGVDKAIIHPTLRGYRKVVPQPARTGLQNFLRNLKSPIVFANQLLQGDLDGAGDAFVRASVNTFVGFGGLVDVAAHEGIEYEREDFGQTLAVWGIGSGPYLMVPLVGPSTVRDATGYIVDALADPLRIYWDHNGHEGRNNVRMAGDYLVLKDQLMDMMESLEYGAIDYYATVRSAYYQNREAEVQDQSEEVTASVEIPEYEDDDF